MGSSIWFWVAFHVLIIGFLFLDLKIFQRYLRITEFKTAWIITGFWILLALIFNLGIYFWQGSKVALEFFSGYLIEKSLSIDNLFVFLLIFQAFQIPKKQQQRVLFWGILGALFFRIGFILLGAKLVHSFDWVLYIFAIILVFTAYKLLKQKAVFDMRQEVFEAWLMNSGKIRIGSSLLLRQKDLAVLQKLSRRASRLLVSESRICRFTT